MPGVGVGDTGCSPAVCARSRRVFFVRSSTPRASGWGLNVVSGADEFAGSSAVNSGKGAVAQPANRPKATNSAAYEFII